MTLAFDHLAVLGASLEEAVDHVEAILGVSLESGGVHAEMGTHNRLISLGPGHYLEAIAVNPKAPEIGRARWFGLDSFEGPARLGHWIAKTGDLSSNLAAAPEGMGVPVALSRGDLAWTMAVPENGVLPFEGAVPALIEWSRGGHPSAHLPDRGLRLRRLHVTHPLADHILGMFPGLRAIPEVVFEPGPAAALLAEIETPSGLRILR